MLANVTPLAKVEPFGFVNCLEAVYKFISKSPLADWQTGTGGHPIGRAWHWAGMAFEMLAARPKILRETTRCPQLCDDYIPWTAFKGNYPNPPV